MNRLRLALRFVHIAFVCWLMVSWYVLRRIGKGFGLSKHNRDVLRGEVLASLLERLGATFIKFGQIMSTRPDLLSPGYTEALAKLQDGVAPASKESIDALLEEELGDKRGDITLESEPVAAASVAQVYRGTLVGGEAVAVKIQRPLAALQIERDLTILSMGARMLNVIPSVRLLSLPGSVDRFGEALRGQLDFQAETEHNRKFAENFADVEGISVPKLYPELCTSRVITMEFVEGVKATEPEKVGGDRKRLARLGAECILKMVFTDGFVHADLHPGNIILTPDDQVVLIDLGMVTEIPRDLLRPWVETFMALSQQDGASAARVFYGYAPNVGNTDYRAFEAEVVEYMKRLYGKKLAEVEVSEAVGGMMNVLRRHHVQIDPTFTVVNLGMLVAEGLGKQLDPDIDLLPLAMPYLGKAMLAAPEGRPPNREIPTDPEPAAAE